MQTFSQWTAPRIRKQLLSLLVSFVVALFAPAVWALQVPPIEGRINDRAQLLSPSTAQQLDTKLADFERKTGHQLALLTIPSLEGDAIEDFGIRVVESWKLGRQGRDDGILVLVAVRDRKMRIEVGYGLEGELPDAVASRIVRDVMAPRFRAGDFEGGISTAIDAIIRKTGGAPDANPTAPTAVNRPVGVLGHAFGFLVKLVLFGVFGVALLFIMLMNRFGGPRGGIFLGGGGFSGGGGFGGGGGFSGGGGSFGGGGASGNW